MSLVYATKCDGCGKIRGNEDGWAHNYNNEKDYCSACLPMVQECGLWKPEEVCPRLWAASSSPSASGNDKNAV